jgi:hypothetical protein
MGAADFIRHFFARLQTAPPGGSEQEQAKN